MAIALPQWFTSELTPRLSGVTRPNPASVQHYAHCPVPRHPDRHRSFGFKPGDSLPLVYQCHVDCSNEEIREELLDRGVPEEYLGPIGTPPFEARRRAAANGVERRQIADLEKQVERMRWEMLELKSSVLGLMNSDLKLALLKIRILAVMEDEDVPVEESPYVAFAMRAGVPKPTAYRVWKDDPLVRWQSKGVVSEDHVVLARPDDGSQVAQVNEAEAIIKSRTIFSKRERLENPDYRNDNASTSNDYQNDNGLAPSKPAALPAA